MWWGPSTTYLARNTKGLLKAHGLVVNGCCGAGRRGHACEKGGSGGGGRYHDGNKR